MKRSTGIVFLLAAALAAFVYFYDLKHNPASATSTTDTSKPAFTSVTSGDVQEIKIQRAGTTMDFDHKSDGWYMTQPRAQRADAGALDGLAGALSYASVDRTFPATPDNLSSFGLKDPTVTVDFKLKNGTSHEMRFGAKDFSSSSIYALIDNGSQVSLMSDAVYTSSDKAPDDFRDKSLTTVQATDANFFDLVNSSGELSGTKKGDTWTLDKPRVAPGDHSKIDALLSSIAGGQITHFVTDSNASLAKYGLDKPAIRFQAKLADGKSVSIEVGKKEGDDYDARNLAQPGVFQINDNLYSILSDKYIDLRDKQIVHVTPADATRLDVHNLNGSFACVKSDSGFVLEQPASADKKAAPPACPNLVDELQDDQADEVYDTPAASVSSQLAKPPVQITITDKNGKKTELVFSGITGDSIYGRNSDSPAIYKFAERVFDEVNFPQPQ